MVRIFFVCRISDYLGQISVHDILSPVDKVQLLYSLKDPAGHTQICTQSVYHEPKSKRK